MENIEKHIYDKKVVSDKLKIKITCNQSDAKKEFAAKKEASKLTVKEAAGYVLASLTDLNNNFIVAVIIKDNKEVFSCTDEKTWDATLKNFNL